MPSVRVIYLFLLLLLLCGFGPSLSLPPRQRFILVLRSRLAAHNTTEHQVHVDKRRRGINGLRGDR